MTITDEERREVARKLREQDIAEFRESAIVPFLECLGIGYENWRGVLDRLADLIDRPTCRMEPSFGGIGIRQWECSACGSLCMSHYRSRYCPNCGAEVVK